MTFLLTFLLGIIIGAVVASIVVFRVVLARMANIIARMDGAQIDELAQRVTDARFGPEPAMERAV